MRDAWSLMSTLSVLIPALWSLLLAMCRGKVACRVQENLTISRVSRSGGGGGGGGGRKAATRSGSVGFNARKKSDDRIVYVDGSVNQGAAGVGVWYGAGHRLNFAAALPTDAADNNVTELLAIFVALLRHPRHARLAIHTDSRACMTTLEMLASGAPVCLFRPSTPSQRDLVRALRWVLFWRTGRTVVHKIKGHSGHTPNERADQLAALGAKSGFLIDVPGYGAGQAERGLLSWVFRRPVSRGLFPGSLRLELVRFLAGIEGSGTGAIGDNYEAFTRKKTATERPQNPYLHHKGPLVTPSPLDENRGITDALALDCEMVGVGPDGERSILAQVSVVNESGNVVYTSYVAPTKKVTNYRTHVSGILPRHLENAPLFSTVQSEVRVLLSGKIVIGHALENDFDALQMRHPPHLIRDTAHWRPFLRLGRFSKRLRHLARDHCGLKIQCGSHDPAEDARAAMYLYLKFRHNWEGQVHATRQGRDGRGRVYHY